MLKHYQHKNNNIPNVINENNLFPATNIFTCAKCSEIFMSESSLGKHLKNHQNEVKGNFLWPCKVCPLIFSNKNILEKHSKKHNTENIKENHYNSTLENEKPDNRLIFGCEICKKTFNSIYVLARHSRSHNKNGLIRCPFCMFKFVHEKDIDEHLKTAHDDVMNTLQDTLPKNEYKDDLVCVKNILTDNLNPHISNNHDHFRRYDVKERWYFMGLT